MGVEARLRSPTQHFCARGELGEWGSEARWAGVRLKGRRKFFVKGDTTFARQNYGGFEKESRRSVERAGRETREIELPNVQNVENERVFCGR